jgi:ribosome recycling factor
MSSLLNPSMTEERRKEVFRALVEAQDKKVPVSKSRRQIADRFGLSDGQLLAIEEEGTDNEWPPLS